MTKKNKYHTTATMLDVARWLGETEADWVTKTELVLGLSTKPIRWSHVEITIREGNPHLLPKALYGTRKPLDVTTNDKFAATLLRALMEAYNELQATPWNWSHAKRAQVVQEEG